MRTDARPGWRALVGHALAAPIEQPLLWLLGTLSFSLRGGIVFLLAPIVVLPTQVEVRLMLGNNLGPSGFTPGFFVGVGAVTIGATGLVMVVLYALARIEFATYHRLTAQTDYELPANADPGAPMRDLFVVEALTVMALLLAAVPLATGLGAWTYQEILLPSSSAPLYDRVLAHLWPSIAILVVALLVIDSVSAVWVRGLLDGKSVGSALVGSVRHIVRRPLWLGATVVIGWLALVLVIAGADWALSIAWQATRAAFLATTSIGDLFSSVAPLVIAVVLAGVFVCGLAICGYVAGFRNALWTVTGLRR